MQKVSKIILLNNKNEFLFHLRDNKPNIIAPNQWALIGGEINFEETFLQGLEREIQEEIPECCVENIRFIGEAYIEATRNNPKLIGFSINKKYKIKNKKNLLSHSKIFKGRINEDIGHINQRLTEGQRAGYFKLEEFNKINLNYFEKSFIYQSKDKIF